MKIGTFDDRDRLYWKSTNEENPEASSCKELNNI